MDFGLSVEFVDILFGLREHVCHASHALTHEVFVELVRGSLMFSLDKQSITCIL